MLKNSSLKKNKRNLNAGLRGEGLEAAAMRATHPEAVDDEERVRIQGDQEVEKEDIRAEDPRAEVLQEDTTTDELAAPATEIEEGEADLLKGEETEAREVPEGATEMNETGKEETTGNQSAEAGQAASIDTSEEPYQGHDQLIN